MQEHLKEMLDEHVGLQIAPLIDVVFLLLIYFMVTSSLKKSEADLGITLPGNIQVSQVLRMPDEQIIEVDAQGRIILNNTVYGDAETRDVPDLVTQLLRYRQASDNAQTKALITIQAEDDAMHERTIDVMNACAGAGIKHVTFGMGSE